MDYGLVYTLEKKQEVLVGYSDSDHARDIVGRSTCGMAFYFNESLITWNSHKEQTVALSSCEAEFMAAIAVAMQGLWLRNLLAEITGSLPQKVKLYVNNNLAIALMKKLMFHGRSKNIDTKYHFIRECVETGQFQVRCVNTEE